MRTVDAAITAALEAPVVRGIYYVALHFDSGIAAWHTGFGNKTFATGGVTTTFLGVGNIANISVIKEETGMKAAGMSVGVSGIKEEIVALLIGQPYINRKAYVYFMPLDENDIEVANTPYMLNRFNMDSITGTMGANASFTVTLKSRFADWERPRKILYTDVQQQQMHPGDLGMEYAAQLSQKKIIWPRAAFLPDSRD